MKIEKTKGMVYSTDTGRTCPGCGHPAKQCCCSKEKSRQQGDQRTRHGKSRREEQTKEGSRNRNRVRDRLLIKVDKRGHDHERDEHNVSKVLSVQNCRRRAKAGESKHTGVVGRVWADDHPVIGGSQLGQGCDELGQVRRTYFGRSATGGGAVGKPELALENCHDATL